jgi:Phospholipase_D-nuclease N-terminal
MDWTFGTFLWSTMVFFFWIVCIWMFIGVFADILRRDLSGWAKAGWIALIVVLPFLGILIYLIARPKTAGEYGYLAREDRARGGVAGASAADQIAKAAQLHDEGRITADEFERLKQQALSY